MEKKSKDNLENSRKIRLLKLWQLLEQKTDPENPMSTKELLSELNEMGLSCDRRTLAKDIATLNEYNFEVMPTSKGHGKAYYVDDRTFQLAEVRLLMDAVRCAKFLTESKTEKLMDKIARLAGDHKSDLLVNQTLVTKTPKHSNEKIYYNIDTLARAISLNQKVKFRYFHLDDKKQKIYNSDYYIISPITLQYDDNHYYLIGESEIAEKLLHYRIDRMESVELLDEKTDFSNSKVKPEIEQYTKNIFHMYSGEITTVTLEFHEKLIGVIYDKFGEDIYIRKTGASTFSITTDIQISPTFFGWLFQFADSMKIIKPVSLINVYRERCMTAYDKHNYYQK